ncbi:Phospholipase_B [Hexamita inflata]|uniref:Phospholipase B-like n=1 Tax=Hexamita inflata TaxID=28002 RepID=A0AA86QLD4_9EUKA|nr:Phospholipase B [Hexamita inflata]CAI9960353.1 Phospholipase B [Hexamita inflata]
MYLAGYAEGFVTCAEIDDYLDNAYAEATYQGHLFPTPELRLYVRKQLEYFQKNIENKNSQTPFEANYWKSVSMALKWLQGVSDGYNQATNSNYMNLEELYYLNSILDYGTLVEYFDPQEAGRFRDAEQPTHCTGIVYPTEDYKDLFFSHVTWSGFRAGFNRILKTFNLKLNLSTTKQQQVQSSSYPGLFASQDDFYIIKNMKHDGSMSNIAVLESTFVNQNETLNTLITESSVLSWMRSLLSCLNTGEVSDFASFYTYNNSFTYNNHYVLLDYKQFQKALSECPSCDSPTLLQHLRSTPLLFSLEMADLASIQFKDVTTTLYDQNFYASLNAPISPSVHHFYNYSSDSKLSYNKTSRLCTIKRTLGQKSVKTFDEFKQFMRSNQFLSYPSNTCQYGDPREGIAARYDLCIFSNTYFCFDQHKNKIMGADFGATDAKYTNLDMMNKGSYQFVYGPTLGSETKGNFPRVMFAKFGYQPKGVPHLLPMETRDVFYTITNLDCCIKDEQ